MFSIILATYLENNEILLNIYINEHKMVNMIKIKHKNKKVKVKKNQYGLNKLLPKKRCQKMAKN